MASPQQPIADGEPDPEGGQPGQNGAYDETSQEQQAAAAAAATSKKKRAYAGQAYEFGAGANAALGGQQPGGAQYPGSPPNASAGGYGYPGQQQTQQPSYGIPPQPSYGDPNVQAQAAQPAYGGQQPQYGAPQGGYEPPQAGYPTQTQQPQQQAVPQQQFSQMSIGSSQQNISQMRLNPLQPVDISVQGQPFHVADLDQPPPPIILPPNVSVSRLRS